MAVPLQEILDRLTGLNLLKREVEQTAANIQRLSELANNHEHRLIRIETLIEASTRHRLSK